jgi:hypothetical protein
VRYLLDFDLKIRSGQVCDGKHGQGTYGIYQKWVLINWLKIPQMPKSLSAQIGCPSPKVWDFDEEILHWSSVVCGYM